MRVNVVIGSMTLGLTATLLAACGGGGSSSTSSGSYCDELKSDKTYFDSLNGSNADMSKLDTVFAKMHTLADKAPDNVSADWKTLDNAITTLQDALKAAGITPSDLASMQAGQVPKDVDPAKLQAVLPKLQALNSSDVSAAADKIAADAKKTCGVDLSAG
ncbi:MAG TPA: hypothetical protein VGK78_16025 [Nocardioides sp.]|uniref:hypothetical protein n=1 Tax=Nocardioides sp. TaxID=35761 RepID=UPI002F3E1FCB